MKALCPRTKITTLDHFNAYLSLKAAPDFLRHRGTLISPIKFRYNSDSMIPYFAYCILSEKTILMRSCNALCVFRNQAAFSDVK